MAGAPSTLRAHMADGHRHTAAARIQRAWLCREARFELRYRRLHRQNCMSVQRREQAARAIQGFAKDMKKKQVLTAIKTTVDQVMAPPPPVPAADDHSDDDAPCPRLVAAVLTIQCAYRSYNARFESEWRRERRQRAREALAARELEEAGQWSMRDMLGEAAGAEPAAVQAAG